MIDMLPPGKMAVYHMLMKRLYILAALLLLPASGGLALEGSWFFDARRFYLSSHGEFTCDECHPDILDPAAHPDPAWVNRGKQPVSDQQDRCSDCHSYEIEAQSEGQHGRLKLSSDEVLSDCLTCHNPHESGRLTDKGRKRLSADVDIPLGETSETPEAEERVSPVFSEEDAACLRCHAMPPLGKASEQSAFQALCLHCHGQRAPKPGALSGPQDGPVPAPVQIGALPLQSTPHDHIGCLDCHIGAAGYPHGYQQTARCQACHFPHPAATAGDVHSGVECEACHIPGATATRDVSTGTVRRANVSRVPHSEKVHDVRAEKSDQSCSRCHHPESEINAPAMVLPAKSILCMPCHAATVSAEDPITIAALAVFAIGLLYAASFWLSGSRGSRNRPLPFHRKTKSSLWQTVSGLVRILVLDVLLNRRLFVRSTNRWIIHALIFWPFLLRFLWGAAGLIASHAAAESTATWHMLNRNHAVTAFFFDMTGLMVLTGVVLAILRRCFQEKPLPAIPVPDVAAVSLLGGIAISGFVAEGMRMALGSLPVGAAYGFVGYAIRGAFLNMPSLNVVYAYTWYVHAVLTGCFVAYLPFSRMMHIILSPIVMIVNGSRNRHTKETE